MVVCMLGMAGGSFMAKTPRVVNPGGADRGVVDDTPPCSPNWELYCNSCKWPNERIDDYGHYR